MSIVRSPVRSAVRSAVRGALGASSQIAYDYYVDSVNGDDGNDGLTPATAFQTISALSISDGMQIGLAAGSEWQEEINTTATGVGVYKYGVGCRPILDASDAATNASFSLSDGLTNTYEISWTHTMAASSGKLKISVFEDGVRLTRATSAANCDVTPGSFFAGDPNSGSPITVYVHASDSSNVSANGKAYRISRRSYGVRVGNNSTVVGVLTKNQGHNDGSLVAGTNCILRNCVAVNGTIHNVFLASGIAEDCIAYEMEQGAAVGSTTMFVSFMQDSTGSTVVYRRCRAIRTVVPTNNGTVGFYAHAAGAEKYASVLYEDCEAANVFEGISGNAVTCEVSNFLIQNVTFAIGAVGYTNLTLRDSTINGNDATGNNDMIRMINGVTTTLTVDNVDVVARASSGALIFAGAGQAASITNSNFVFRDKLSFPHIVYQNTGASGSLTFNNNNVDSASTGLNLGAGVTLTADNNNYSPSTTDMIWNGTTYNDIAAYKTASGQDANATTNTPTYAQDPSLWAKASTTVDLCG